MIENSQELQQLSQPIDDPAQKSSKIKQLLVIFAVALVLLALTFFFWHISQGLALVLKP